MSLRRMLLMGIEGDTEEKEKITLQSDINNGEELLNFVKNTFGLNVGLAAINRTAADDWNNRVQYDVVGFLIYITNGTVLPFSCYIRKSTGSGYQALGNFSDGYLTKLYAGDEIYVTHYANQ